MNWRIVYNKETRRYRIEQKRWWGWDFVVNASAGEYISFTDLADAKRWACHHLGQQRQTAQRWQVVDASGCPSSADRSQTPGPTHLP